MPPQTGSRSCRCAARVARARCFAAASPWAARRSSKVMFCAERRLLHPAPAREVRVVVAVHVDREATGEPAERRERRRDVEGIARGLGARLDVDDDAEDLEEVLLRQVAAVFAELLGVG